MVLCTIFSSTNNQQHPSYPTSTPGGAQETQHKRFGASTFFVTIRRIRAITSLFPVRRRSCCISRRCSRRPGGTRLRYRRLPPRCGCSATAVQAGGCDISLNRARKKPQEASRGREKPREAASHGLWRSLAASRGLLRLLAASRGFHRCSMKCGLDRCGGYSACTAVPQQNKTKIIQPKYSNAPRDGEYLAVRSFSPY